MSARREPYWLIGLAAAAGLGIIIAGREYMAKDSARSLEANLKAHPKDLRLEEKLADALVREHRSADSVPHYQAVIKADPANTKAVYALVQVFLGDGKSSDAQITLNDDLRLRPDDQAMNQRLAGLVEEGLKANGDDAALLERKGDVFMRDHRVPEAITQYQKAMLADPKSTSAPYALACALAIQGESQKAQDLVSANLKLHPDDAGLNELQAELVVKSLGIDIARPTAQKYYEIAVRSDPTRAAAAVAISKIKLAAGDVEGAATILEKPLAAHPRDAALHLQMAAVMTKLKQYNPANEHFNKGTVLDPKNAQAFFDWGTMLVDADRAVAAELVLRTSLELNPRSAKAHMQLGRALREMALMNQARMQDALDEFTKSFDLDATYPPTYYECAQTMLAMHNEASAVKYLKDAVTLDDHYAEALVALAKLRMNAEDASLRDPRDALFLLKQAVDATGKKDVSLLVGFARALAAAGEYDTAAEEMTIALGAENLTPVQREFVERLRQEYLLANTPMAEGPANVLNLDAMVPHDPLERDEWPKAVQPPIKKIMERPLSISKPPGPGSALDPELFKDVQPPPSMDLPPGFIR